MKTSIFPRLLLAVSLLAFAAHASAQTSAPAVAGYWNLETNLTTRDYSIVRFYNSQDQLVYEERLEGLCVDLSRGTGLCRRTKRQLNVALQHVLQDPATPRATTLIAGQIGRHPRAQRTYAMR